MTHEGKQRIEIGDKRSNQIKLFQKNVVEKLKIVAYKNRIYVSKNLRTRIHK